MVLSASFTLSAVVAPSQDNGGGWEELYWMRRGIGCGCKISPINANGGPARGTMRARLIL